MSIQLSSLTSTQLRRAADLKEKIARLEKKLASILGSTAPMAPPAKKRTVSAATKKKMKAAQQARWAKVKAAGKKSE